ncbi:Cell division inhibitor [Salmonella enterica subsp. arizonae]|uniref:Cell division inhibitor n=1 Tax=Salmonella enterica subsp. arizonae TaxID=59203 RepID=A0A379SVF2_SALER|nr:Cell division inhibitor [Salmonella enterica subsp. arizonae]
MQILITGGTGLIGRHLIPRLLTLGHQVTVVTRNPYNARQIFDSRVALWKGLAEREHLNEIDAIVNLAGEPIADKRWTPQQKERLCQSRWAITQKLVDLIHASATPPAVLISGSATGYYGDLGDVVVTEDEPPHNEFTHKLCAPLGADCLSRAERSDPRLPAAYRRRTGAARRDSGENGSAVPPRSRRPSG